MANPGYPAARGRQAHQPHDKRVYPPTCEARLAGCPCVRHRQRHSVVRRRADAAKPAAPALADDAAWLVLATPALGGGRSRGGREKGCRCMIIKPISLFASGLEALGVRPHALSGSSHDMMHLVNTPVTSSEACYSPALESNSCPIQPSCPSPRHCCHWLHVE